MYILCDDLSYFAYPQLQGYDDAIENSKSVHRFWLVAEQVAPSASEEDLIKEDSLGERSQDSFSSQAARDMEELGKICVKKIESPEHINDGDRDLRGLTMQEGLDAMVERWECYRAHQVSPQPQQTPLDSHTGSDSVKKCFEDAAPRVGPDAGDLPGQSECREEIGSDDAAPHVGPDARDLPGRDACREVALVVDEDQNRAPEQRDEEDGCPEEKIGLVDTAGRCVGRRRKESVQTESLTAGRKLAGKEHEGAGHTVCGRRRVTARNHRKMHRAASVGVSSGDRFCQSLLQQHADIAGATVEEHRGVVVRVDSNPATLRARDTYEVSSDDVTPMTAGMSAAADDTQNAKDKRSAEHTGHDGANIVHVSIRLNGGAPKNDGKGAASVKNALPRQEKL